MTWRATLMRRQSRWRRLLKPKKRPKRCQSHRGRHLGETNFVQQRFFVVAWNPVQRHEARSQEGVMNFHVCLKLINSLWEAFEMKAQSPEKFMDVSDVKVTDEGGSLQCSKTIKANNKIVKERIWINPVTSMIETQPLETDTDQLHAYHYSSRGTQFARESYHRDVTECVDLFKEFKTARANVQEVRLEPGRALTLRFVRLSARSLFRSTEL